MAEDQLGPKSPTATTEQQAKLFTKADHGAARRIRPGTRATDMADGPPLVSFSEEGNTQRLWDVSADSVQIDSAFQLTEHLKALHYALTHPDSATMVAIDKDMAHRLAEPPEGVDRALWLYELCRFVTQRVNAIIVALFSDSPPCSANTCPEMRASEWQYLCAVHNFPKPCCAIDYCCHTLDWAANTLTSPKHFPSRLSLGVESTTAHQQVRQLTNIFRRVYRIFAHAWFQHRDIFWKVESRTGLYVLFKTVCDVYALIPEDNFTIPPEAEGLETMTDLPSCDSLGFQREKSGAGEGNGIQEVGDHTFAAGSTTKRHRHSPSVSAMSVDTVVEENEEEEEKEEAVEAQSKQESLQARDYGSEGSQDEGGAVMVPEKEVDDKECEPGALQAEAEGASGHEEVENASATGPVGDEPEVAGSAAEAALVETGGAAPTMLESDPAELGTEEADAQPESVDSTTDADRGAGASASQPQHASFEP